MNVKTIDLELIQFFKRVSIPVARFGMFVVYFWFGILKLLGYSPASPLVQALFDKTIHFMPFPTFMAIFACFEMLIGILFLVKGAERIVLPILFCHMIMVFMPLILLPGITWQGFMIPTLEGQYIIKNLVIIAVGIGIAANLHPLIEKDEKNS
jgi:uncharacterized membrane protein YkgB